MTTDEESDDALIARAGRGDRLEASILIARHSPRVLSLCRHMLKDRTAAEDAAQETFLRLWEGAAVWRRHDAKLETWLYRVATNACIDRHRSARRDAPEEAAGEQLDSAPSAVERLSDADKRRAIEAALEALPERQRIAMTLRHYRDLTNIEIAQAMSTSVDAVESLLARARRALTEALSGMREELMESAE
ncbi:MAG: sigma-70 family RNA polymerase sigma factor [Pseudomonadota bacterium]